VLVCVIGNFDPANPAHVELEPALRRAHTGGDVLEVRWVAPEAITEDGVLKHLTDADALIGAPGPIEDLGGYLDAVEFAREGGEPYLGVELGMDLAVVEFAKTVLVWPRAHSHEFDDAQREAVVTRMDPPPAPPGKQAPIVGALGVKFTKEGPLAQWYGAPSALEEHRTEWGVPPSVRNQLFRAGLKTVATDESGFLVRALQLADHPYFVLTSFVPWLGPAAKDAHPLFKPFLEAASG